MAMALPDDGDPIPPSPPETAAGAPPASEPKPGLRVTRGTPPRLAFRLEVGRTISRSFSIWIKSFVPFTILSLVANAPLIVFTYFFILGGPTDRAFDRYNLLARPIDMLIGSVLSGAVAHSVFQHLRGKPASMGSSLGIGLKSLLKVLAVSFVTGLMMMVGLIFLIIPGLIVACTYCVAVPAAVVERTGVGASLRRSEALTRGNRWTIFGVFFVVGLFTITAATIIQMTLIERGGAATYQELALNTVLGQILLSLFAPVSAVFPSVVYHDLRIGKEGATAEDLAAVFD